MKMVTVTLTSVPPTVGRWTVLGRCRILTRVTTRRRQRPCTSTPVYDDDVGMVRDTDLNE